MLCGSFSNTEDEAWNSSSPRRSRRKDKNPYADCGRDKFATVLAELEARREKIMAQVGQQDVFLVRFAQTSSRDWVPIVVKAREPKRQKTVADTGKYWPVHLTRGAAGKSPTARESSRGKEMVRAAAGATAAANGRKKKSFSWWWKGGSHDLLMNLQKPSGYWSLVLIMILVCLAMFGRSFAILCTSVWWYLMPTLKSTGSANWRRSVKKSYRRGLSEKNLRGAGDERVVT